MNSFYHNRPIQSVSELNLQVKRLLEGQFQTVWVQGEISNLSRPGSGHWYFTLKDSRAQIRCAMFRNRNRLIRMQPNHGDEVIARGQLSLYEGRGDYQLIVEHLEASGEGRLQREFEQLKQKLHQLGLFDPAHKRPVPSLIHHLAIITSPTGAALQDVLQVMNRRFPATRITVIPSAVQGKAAAGQLITALTIANQPPKSDPWQAVLLTRGGGSLEDLWCFNEQAVAEAIFRSELPIISAIGHEIDFTIVDFVADIRAPTPSAAAELLTVDQRQFRHTLIQQQQRLNQLIWLKLEQSQLQLKHLRARLRNPIAHLNQQRQYCDDLSLRLNQAIERWLNDQQKHLLSLKNQLSIQRIEGQWQYYQETLRKLQQRLQRAIMISTERHQRRLEMLASALEHVSPLQTLKRGYAVIRDQEQAIVRDSHSVSVGAKITAYLGQGRLECVVAAISEESLSEEF